MYTGSRNISLQDQKKKKQTALESRSLYHLVGFCLHETHAEFSGPGVVEVRLRFSWSSQLTSMCAEEP